MIPKMMHDRISQPEHGGPCPDGCVHYYCDLWRRIAAEHCCICGEPIGYDRDLRRDYMDVYFVHETCVPVWKAVDRVFGGISMQHATGVFPVSADVARYIHRRLTAQQAHVLLTSIDLAVRIAYPGVGVVLMMRRTQRERERATRQIVAVRGHRLLPLDESNAIRDLIDRVIAEYLARLDGSGECSTESAPC